MSEAETAPRPRRRLLLALGLIGLAAALVGVYGIGTGLRNPAEGAICRASIPVTAHLASHARGEVAAFTAQKEPKLLPDLAFNGPDGAPLKLSSFRGKVVLINLWATWCVPCRKEMPALDQLQMALGGADFSVVAINIDTRDPAKPREWLKENGIKTLGYYADPSGKVFQDLKLAGKALGLPTTLLVDAHGCELGALNGPAEWASPDALTLIREALKKG